MDSRTVWQKHGFQTQLARTAAADFRVMSHRVLITPFLNTGAIGQAFSNLLAVGAAELADRRPFFVVAPPILIWKPNSSAGVQSMNSGFLPTDSRDNLLWRRTLGFQD